MNSFIAYVLSLSLLVAMGAGILLPMSGLVTVVISITWVICILAIPIAIVTIAASELYESSKGETRKKIGKLLSDAAKKKNIIARITGWSTFLVMTFMFAWSGWVITAISYVLASLIILFAKSIAKDEAIKQGLA